MINFNEPVYVEKGIGYITEAILKYRRLNGDGNFTKKCTKWFEEKYGKRVLFTTSCTHALEMAALLCDIRPGDEVIMPSFTFVSTADAFVLRGAKIKFVDIRPDTMNIDEKLIESAITDKTRAIVPVHYAGVSCEMDTILDIAKKHNLFVIEDAAQGMMSSYKGRALGTIGDFGAYSFHETKNYTMGEGGLIFVNREEYVHEAEIIREKGTKLISFLQDNGIKAVFHYVSLHSSKAGKKFGEIIIYVKEDNRPIGSIFLKDIDLEKQTAEYGNFIGEEDCLGKGYGSDAGRTLIKYAFEKLGMKKIYLRVLQENVRAVNAYKKMGFVKTGSEYNEDVKAEVIYMEVTDIDFHHFS
ncbi:MAG: GNAT family N-acetyltransferase [Lachnospiraceae bacterium]|nr:GNAT family N-acetyltransferase [Lachnospiraceae bacterium]